MYFTLSNRKVFIQIGSFFKSLFYNKQTFRRMHLRHKLLNSVFMKQIHDTLQVLDIKKCCYWMAKARHVRYNVVMKTSIRMYFSWLS